MKKYPLEPTVFEKWIYDPEWFDRVMIPKEGFDGNL